MVGPLALVLHIVVAATLMGIAITAALVAGASTGPVLISAAVGGFLAGFPVSWAIVRAITRSASSRN